MCADAAPTRRFKEPSTVWRGPGIRWLCLYIALIAMLGGCSFGGSSNTDPEPTPTNGFFLGQSRLGIDRLGPPQMADDENSDNFFQDNDGDGDESAHR